MQPHFSLIPAPSTPTLPYFQGLGQQQQFQNFIAPQAPKVFIFFPRYELMKTSSQSLFKNFFPKFNIFVSMEPKPLHKLTHTEIRRKEMDDRKSSSNQPSLQPQTKQPHIQNSNFHSKVTSQTSPLLYDQHAHHLKH